MEFFTNMFTEMKQVFQQGGVVLWLIVALSIFMYGLLFSTWMGLFKVKAEIKELEICSKNETSERSVECDVTIFELDRFAWVKRRVPMIATMVAIAPLAGLLGTVVGMLITFSGLATQVSAKPIDTISFGISSAMITTQAGLFMAIPGAILLAMLKSQINGVQGTLQERMHQHIIEKKGARA